MRRDARRSPGQRNKLGVISQRRWYEPVKRMKAAIDAGKIGQPVLGVFTMYSWRDPAYYLSDPWRGRWDTEGGGVLVNQSPHKIDLVQWLMGEMAEVSGYWANLNHPSIEVEDRAVAILRFRNGGLGSIVASLSQNREYIPRCTFMGRTGRRRRRDRPRCDIHRRCFDNSRTTLERPVDDPGRRRLLAQLEIEDRARFREIDAVTHYHAARSRTSCDQSSTIVRPR